MSERRNLGELLAEAAVLLGAGSHRRLEELAERIDDPAAWSLAVDTYRQRPARSNPLAYFARVLESKRDELRTLRQRESAAPEIHTYAYHPPQGFRSWPDYYGHLARWRRQQLGPSHPMTRAAEILSGPNGSDEEQDDGVSDAESLYARSAALVGGPV